jgi:hypothetical protein
MKIDDFLAYPVQMITPMEFKKYRQKPAALTLKNTSVASHAASFFSRRIA